MSAPTQYSRPTPLFAAAAALLGQDARSSRGEDDSLNWLNVGSTFIDVPHSWAASSAGVVAGALRGGGRSPDEGGGYEDGEGELDDGSSGSVTPPPATDEPMGGVSEVLPPVQPPAPPSLFVDDRRGDRDQARFQRMYAGDVPAYHAPSAASRHAPVGTNALARRRGRRVRIVAVPEGVGSGVIRPALSRQEAEAARAGGGVWAQVRGGTGGKA